MAVDVSRIPNNNKFDPVREAILQLQTEIEDTGATIGNGTLTISTSSPLTGSGTFTANQTGPTSISIGIDGAEYLTNITHDTVNQKLVVTYGDGTTADLSLAQYIDDTNLARLVSGSLDNQTGIATFTRDDATTFTVDLSALFDDTDTNDFLTSASFSTANGIITFGVTNQNSVTVDIDGRYPLIGDLTAVSNDIITSADFSATDNRFKLTLTQADAGTIEASFDDVVLSESMAADYIPYVKVGGGDGDTTNAVLNDSFLKINGSTLELDWGDTVGVYTARDIKMRKDGGGFGTYYEATYAADSVSFLHYASASDIDTAKIGATSTGRVRINDTYSLPVGDGTSGQVLSTNGSGDLSWVAAGGSLDLQDVTDNGATTTNPVTFQGNVNIDTGQGGSSTDAYTAYDRIVFDNAFSDVARGANKIVFYDDAWLGGIGVHDDTVAYYSGGEHIWYESNSTVFSQKMRLTDGGSLITEGRIGISGQTPKSNLHIGNNVSTGGFSNYTDYQILLYDGGTVPTSYGIGIEGGTLMFNSDNRYRFYSQNTLVMTITDGGSIENNGNIIAGGNGRISGTLGIGTTNVNRQFVVSNAGGNGIELDANQSGLSEIISYDRTLNAYTPLVFVASRYQFDTGSVGIGIASPSAKLDITNNNSAVSLLIRNGDVSDGSNNEAQIQFGYNGTDDFSHFIRTRHNSADSGGNAIDFYTCDSTENNSITSGVRHNLTLDSGKVGIGTDSPSTKLHIYNSSGDADFTLQGGSQTMRFDQNSIRTTTSSQIAIFTNNTVSNGIYINSSGSVGVGTTSPFGKFSVEGGSMKLNNDNANGDYYLWLNKKEGRDGGILLQRDNSLDWQMVNVGTSGNLWFYSYGTSSAVLTIERSSGRVGIGSTTPGYKLEVQGSMLATGSTRLATSTDTGVTVGDYHHSSSSSSDTKLILAGKNLQSGSSYYGDYGQLLFRASSNYTGSARQWLVTNALDAYKFSIIMGDSGQVTPTIGAGGGVSGGSPVITIDDGARVGIGTTSPADKLVVIGDIGVGVGGYNGGVYANNTSGSVDKNWGFEVQRTSGVDDYNVRMKYYPVAGTSRACGIYNSASSYFTLYSNQDSDIVITNDLGIGTTPSHRLDVNGSARVGNYLTFTTGTSIPAAAISYHTNGYLYVKGGGGGVAIGDDSFATSIYCIDNGNIEFSTAGNGTKMVLNSSGNLGINQTNPQSKLHITNASGGGGGYLKVTDAGYNGDVRFGMADGIDNDAILGVWTNNNIRAYTNGQERMRIKDNGNVGLSSTVSGWSLGRTLEIGGDNSNIAFSGTSAIFGIVNTYYNGSAYVRRNVGTCASFEYGLAVSNAFSWRLDGSGSAGGNTNLPVKMVLSNAGELGIGTTNPVRQLVVSNGGGNGIELDANQGGVSEIISYNRSTNAYTPLYTLGTELRYYGSEQNFYINNNLIIRLRSNGTVGIGTTGSDAKLEVVHNGDNGSGGDSQYAILAHASSGQATIGAIHTAGGYANLNLGSSGSGSGLEFWHISYRQATDKKLEYYWYSGGGFTSRFEFLTNGDFKAGGDIIAYKSSDERLKDNIKPIENAIDKVKAIGGYEFDWNDKQESYEGHDVGVIAQEIEEVLPEIVTTRDTGYKAVQYEKLVPLLIEAIKEQQKQIDELKARLDA